MIWVWMGELYEAKMGRRWRLRWGERKRLERVARYTGLEIWLRIRSEDARLATVWSHHTKGRFSECRHLWQQKLELRKLTRESQAARCLICGQGMPTVRSAEQTTLCNISPQQPRSLPGPTTSMTTAITHHHTAGSFVGNHKFTKRLSQALYLEGIRREEDLQLILRLPEIEQLKTLNDLREKRKISLKECLLLKCELERKSKTLLTWHIGGEDYLAKWDLNHVHIVDDDNMRNMLPACFSDWKLSAAAISIHIW